MVTSLQAPDVSPDPDNKIKVMVVDDSVVIRGLVARWLDEHPEIEVVSKQPNGKYAINNLLSANPDIVLLDIEMPEMDGIAALPEILRLKPRIKVIMVSTLTRRNADISMKALSLGATDYIPKPESNSGATTSEEFKKNIIEKVLAIGRAHKKPQIVSRKTFEKPKYSENKPATTGTPLSKGITKEKKPLPPLRPFSYIIPRILIIGSSTGGPQALFEVTRSINGSINHLPVIITQHMPATFTTIMAEHITKASGIPCTEAKHGEIALPGRIYVAPGGKHLLLEEQDKQIKLILDDGPQVNFCKPAVDPMFNSAVKIFGAATLAVILTGMGNDGCEGARNVINAGGSVVVQDEETSVVWGMPGAAAQAGVCSAILPLNQIGPRLVRAMKGLVR